MARADGQERKRPTKEVASDKGSAGASTAAERGVRVLREPPRSTVLSLSPKVTRAFFGGDEAVPLADLAPAGFEDALDRSAADKVLIAERTVPNAQRQSSISVRSAHNPKGGSSPMKDRSEVAARLRRAREKEGFATAADFARRWQLNVTTYYHHENGRRDIRPEVARHYATLLNLPAGTLLYGERLHSNPDIPIVGYLVADGKVQAMPEQDVIVKSVPMIDTDGLVGLVVRGDDNYPVYRDGDVIFHQVLEPTNLSLDDIHGLECVIERDDGEVIVRQVSIQRDGRATLFAYNRQPQMDIQVVAAAPIEWVRKAPRR
jgi:phage repressor protein C with HTH and peptisase S24 domain